MEGEGLVYGFETLGVGFTVWEESVGNGKVFQQSDDSCCPACGRDGRISCGKAVYLERAIFSLE